MAELGTLKTALDVVRQRTFLNTLLGRLKWPAAGWLTFLVLALSFSRSLAWLPTAAIVLAAAVVIAVYVRASRARLSHYAAAVKLDEAAELKDRLSTAYYFSDISEPQGLVRRQRDDALAHLSRVHPGRLFPLRMPAGSRWGLVLVAVVALLFAYRLKHEAPLTAIVNRVAETQLVKSIVSPVTHAEEKQAAADRDRRTEQEPGRGQARAGGEDDRQPSADSRGASADGQPAPGDQKGTASQSGAADPRQQQTAQGKEGDGQQSQPGSEHETPQEDKGSGHDGSGGQSQQQQRGGEGQQQQNGGSSQSDSGNQQQGEGNSADNNNSGQSLARQMLNALKNLFSRNNSGQQQQNEARQQSGQRSQEGSQANNSSANAAQQNAQPSQGNQRGSESQSQSASGSQESGQQKSGTGVGQQPGSDGTDAAQQQGQNGSLSPDRVALETHQFSGEAQVRARMGQGDARTAAGNAGAASGARVNGAEQESVPQRYRAYIQRYFDQAAKKKK